jgi:hypothetical protein
MAPQEYRADRAVAVREIGVRDQGMFAAMRVLAERTGGRAFYNNNDLRAAMRRAVDDTRLTYALGYYPSHDSWNGRFREIKVQARRPGLQLHYRRGYFAQPEEPSESWYREGILDAALWSPVDATGLGVTVKVTSSAGVLDLALQLDARDLTFQQGESAWECALDVWLVQLDRKENHVKTDARTNNLWLDAATHRRVIDTGGLALSERVAIAPQASLLRVLVRDIGSGALGSLTIPLRRGPSS